MDVVGAINALQQRITQTEEAAAIAVQNLTAQLATSSVEATNARNEAMLARTEALAATTAAHASAAAPHVAPSTIGGVKTIAPERYSGRPSLSYPTAQHFIDYVVRYMRVGGVSENAQTDYVTLHLLEGEAKSWYDLRVKTTPNESFASFSSALCSHFATPNSQMHYRDALQSLNMRQFRDPLAYNRAFRQMLLCLEDMSEIDKLSHYERGLDTKYRVAVRQQRCTTVESAMAQVDVVHDAHAVDIGIPMPLQVRSAPLVTNGAGVHMGVAPMQLNLIRHRRNGDKKTPKYGGLPRKGSTSSRGNRRDYVDPRPVPPGVVCYSCGKPGHFADRCPNKRGTRRGVVLSMLRAVVHQTRSGLRTTANVDDALENPRNVDTSGTAACTVSIPSAAIVPTEVVEDQVVPQILRAETTGARSSEDGTGSGKGTRKGRSQRSGISGKPGTRADDPATGRFTQSNRSRHTRRGNGMASVAPADGGVVIPRGSGSKRGVYHEKTPVRPAEPRRSKQHGRSNGRTSPPTSGKQQPPSKPPQPPSGRDRQSQATVSSPSMAASQKNVIPSGVRTKPGRAERMSPEASDISRESSQPISSVSAHGGLSPISPIYLDVDVFCLRDRRADPVRTKAMLDSGSSLSFVSTRLMELLKSSIL